MLKRLLDTGSIIRVQTWNSAATPPSSIEILLQVAWPTITGTVASGRADILCIGPTDWLLLAIDPDASALLQRLDEASDASDFRATNVSQTLARIRIEGPEVRDLLAKGCSLDLHPPLFPPGRAARTRFAGMPVIVRCTGAAAFDLIVTRSYLDYLMSWLADAELEFETPVA
jgi:sarcosine oxidase, subunit gamma